jgi:flagellar hook protein FlgE
MSITGLMRTSISGMEAQSNRLSAVSTNIANSQTVGYKSSVTHFSSLVGEETSHGVGSGGVETSRRYSISQQGVLSSSSSKYDLAINGNGYLLVQDQQGAVALTRAGAFVPDGDGYLVNAAGYRLLGLPVSGGLSTPLAVNGTAGLVPIDVQNARLEAAATTQGRLVVNVPSSSSAVAPADLPSANAPSSTSSARTSLVVFGNLGEEITLDIHYARTTTPGVWEVAVFDSADRSPAGGFPYAGAALATTTLNFDVAGQLSSSSAAAINIPVPGGATTDLDLTGTSQLAVAFGVSDVETNGNPASGSASIEVGRDGAVYEIFGNGTRRPVWQLGLATVTSPDLMKPLSGTVFVPTAASGDMRIGSPGSSGFGALVSGALESSTVDLASELTDMIEAQRNYSANSKVFQTGAELLEVLVNLKR